MKLNKILKEQQFEIKQLKSHNQQTIYGKYQATFAYLGDTEFKGEYIELSQILIEPQTDFSSIVFYQQQINLNLKIPINQKSKSMVKKVIEIENNKIKIVRLPKIENQKAIVAQIKILNQIMIARLPNQPQTTKTPLYNKKGQLVGFVGYKMREVNTSKLEHQYNEYEQQFTQYQEQTFSKDKKQIINNEKNDQQMNSENQFLPNQKFQQAAVRPEQNQKLSLNKNDDQENLKLQKRALTKINMSVLVKQLQEKNQIEEIKEQINKQPTKEEINKQIPQQNRLMTKLRQIQNKAQTQKQKMKENQRIKQINRFKIKTNQSSQQKKSEKDSLSEQENDQQKVKGSKLYKIPVQLQFLQSQQNKNLANQNNEKKRISLNFPIQLGNRSYLQKHIKQHTPKNTQSNKHNTNNSFAGVIIANKQDQIKIYRKPGFITSQKREREHIRELTSMKKSQQIGNELQPLKKELLQIKRVHSEDKQVPLPKSNQKFKLAVSRNIFDIKVNQTIKAKRLTKVLNQSYFPKISQKKEYIQKQIPNPMLDLQLQKKQQNQPKQNKQTHKQKSPTNFSTEKQKKNFLKNERFDNQDLISQQSIAVRSDEHSFDIIVSNLSVNLYSKAFGKKFIELSSGRQIYTTDSLYGSHLLWVNRGYLFKKVLSSDFLYVSLKSQADNYLKILGKAKINFNQLLLNYKQSFYQSYLHSPSDQLFAVIIIGYEIFNHHANKITSRNQSINLPVTLTPKKTSKLFKNDKNNSKLPIIVTEQNSRKSQQKRNSQNRKYKGGHNIRLERAGRFNTEYLDDEPGPGYYNPISDFDRHTVSRKQK